MSESPESRIDTTAARTEQRTFSRSEFADLLALVSAETVTLAREEYCEGVLPDEIVYFVDGAVRGWMEDGHLRLPEAQVGDASFLTPLLLHEDGRFQEWIDISPLAVLGDFTVLSVSFPGRWTDRIVVSDRKMFRHDPFGIRGPALPSDYTSGDPVPRVRLPAARLDDRGPNILPEDVEGLSRLSPSRRSARVDALARRLAAGGSDELTRAEMVALAEREEADDTLASWLRYIMVSRAPGFLGRLRKWLDNPDPEVRAQVLGAVVMIDSEEVNAVLLQLLEKEVEPRVRRSAVRSLVRRGSLGEWKPVDLLSVIGDDDWTPHTKREYLRLLGE